MRVLVIFILFFSSIQLLNAQADPSVDVPNVFTPNGDGVNDLFKIKSSGYSKLKCTIYNRYGEVVYEFFGLNGHWDGRTHAGLRCPDGVYFYLVEVSNDDGGSASKQGKLHLFSGTDKPNN